MAKKNVYELLKEIDNMILDWEKRLLIHRENIINHNMTDENLTALFNDLDFQSDNIMQSRLYESLIYNELVKTILKHREELTPKIANIFGINENELALFNQVLSKEHKVAIGNNFEINTPGNYQIEEVFGNLRINCSDKEVKVNKLRTVSQRLTANRTKVKEFPALEHVYGALSIDGALFKELPNLKTTGTLSAQGAKLESVPELTHINGHALFQKSKLKSAPKLEYIKYNADISFTSIEELDALEYIGSTIEAYCSAIKSMKNLKYIGHYGYFNLSKIENLESLTDVGVALIMSDEQLKNVKHIPESTKLKVQEYRRAKSMGE